MKLTNADCDYFAPTGFPAVLDLALRVTKLGKSSVTYEIGVFEQGVEEVKAVGQFIHVYVERDTMKPGAQGINSRIREGLAALSVESKAKL
jgi:acyl-CoA thioester hydrolase